VPVGSFPDDRSWCGAFDMTGSEAEYCSDWYYGFYYYDSPTDDPTGPTSQVLPGGHSSRGLSPHEYTPLPGEVPLWVRYTDSPGVPYYFCHGFRPIRMP